MFQSEPNPESLCLAVMPPGQAMHFNTIQEKTGLTQLETSCALGRLELKGLIERESGLSFIKKEK